jgi:hypothetical protein
MWDSAEILIEFDLVEEDEAIVLITTPAGVIEIAGAVSVAGRVLYLDGVHIQGLHPGAVGRAGLNAIGRKLLEEADVDKIVIQGGVRTTGCNKGRRPRPFRFPND